MSTDLVPTNTATAVTSGPASSIAQQTEVANLFSQAVKERNLAVSMRGNEHLRVEAWQLLAALNGISAVVTDTEKIDKGWKATCEARRLSDGQVVGAGFAICTHDERMWGKADDYAVLSMAQTRATAKAIKSCLGHLAELAGFKTTPAEEMPAEPTAAAASEPAKASGYVNISEKQVKLVRARARSGHVQDTRLVQLVHSCSGSRKTAPEITSEHDANSWLAQNLKFFPWKRMDQLLEAIAAEPDGRSEVEKGLQAARTRDRDVRHGE